MKKSTMMILSALLLAAAFSFSDNTGHRFVNLPTKPANLPFSNAVLAGNTLYLSGSLGLDADRKVPDDLEKEVRIIMDGMKSTLSQVGMTMDDVVWVQVFCPDLTLYDKFNAVYRTYFKDNFPARSFIGSGPLLFNGHFEINAIAVKR